METTLLLAGLRFWFFSDFSLNIDPVLDNFIISAETESKADVIIRISKDWDSLTLPDSSQLGKDMICRYYRQGDVWYCLTPGRPNYPVACSTYKDDFREILCVLNEKPFQKPPENLGSILRMIPMHAIYQRFGVLFLHASRICCDGKAILFSAPSGTGKTTQARLWNKLRKAEILCNDRTLLRKSGGIWNSYGYPMDGSEPVRSNIVSPLGAVVLLKQGSENHVERLRASQAAILLMGQLVIDVWNPDARKAAMDQILCLLEDIPVYLLTCTPDAQAVDTLEEKLKKDGVISVE